jgi:hypothetical protein
MFKHPVTLTDYLVHIFSPINATFGWHSRYSDWLRAGQPKGQISSPGRVKNFLFSTLSGPALDPTQPPVQWIPGALFPGVKQPGHEADHLPPTSAKVKKMNYTSTP